MTSQSAEMTSLSKFFDVILFLLSNVVSGPRFMSIVLESFHVISSSRVTVFL